MTNQEKRTRGAKTIEFEDAPSGMITLYNYKEPFMDFVDEATGGGFGYQGVLMLDAEGDVLQCHLCGNWFNSLQHHIRKEHNVSAKIYKEKVGLNKTTALISDNYRLKLIEAKKQNATLGLNIRAGKPHTEETKKKISDTLRKQTRQTQNVFGTCPLQLKERFMNLADKLGRLPKAKEVQFIESVYRTFGTYANFVKECGYKPRTHKDYAKVKWTTERLKEIYSNLLSKYGKNIKPRHLRKEFGMKKTKADLVLLKIKKSEFYKDMQKEFRDAELRLDKKERLLNLRNFYEINKRLPSGSDFRRKYMGGSPGWYYYHYKTLKNALEEAKKITVNN